MRKLPKHMEEKKRRLQKRLQLYEEAEERILAGQSYTIGSRSLTRANLADVQKMISSLASQIASIDANAGKRKVARIIPRDY